MFHTILNNYIIKATGQKNHNIVSIKRKIKQWITAGVDAESDTTFGIRGYRTILTVYTPTLTVNHARKQTQIRFKAPSAQI